MKRRLGVMMGIALAMTMVVTGCGHEHEFGEWEVTTEASCEETGMEVRSCEGCDETETEVVESTGHDFGEWTVTKEVTCTEDGEQERICSVCGEKETETITSAGHDFEPATMFAPKTCKVCGETEGEALATVLTEGEEVESEDHKFMVKDVYFTSSLSETEGYTTYNYYDGHYMVIQLDFTNLSSETLEKWNSNRVTDMKMTYAGKYDYEGDFTILLGDIVPLGEGNAYICYEVPESMDDDTTSSITASFKIDGVQYAIVVQEGDGSDDDADSEDAADNSVTDTEVTIGDTRTDDENYSFTLSDILYTSDLSESEGNTTYSYTEGHYLVLKLAFTNLSSETLEQWNSNRITNMTATYDGKYEYTGASDVLLGDIVPLQERNLYICYEIPDSIDNDDKTLTATFKVDGDEYTVDCRCE